jgi:hypothetical protein
MKLEFYEFGIIIFLESFVSCKTFVEWDFRTLKLNVFFVNQTFFKNSNLLWAFIYFVRKSCVLIFLGGHVSKHLKMMLFILILNAFND